MKSGTRGTDISCHVPPSLASVAKAVQHFYLAPGAAPVGAGNARREDAAAKRNYRPSPLPPTQNAPSKHGG